MTFGEGAAYRDARCVAERYHASVHLNTKLSDLVDPRRAARDFDWATRAHVDVLVRDESHSLEPLFAIEVDGPHHAEPEQARRDRLKDGLLREAGIDVIRVTTPTVTRQHGPSRLTAYLTEIWFLARWFRESQQAGTMPQDEPFWHTSVVIPDKQGNPASFNPTMAFRSRLWKDYGRHGTPCVPVPQAWIRIKNDIALVDCIAVLALTSELFLYAEVQVGRVQAYGIPNRDIAEEMAFLELGWQYDQYLEHRPVARHINQLAPLLPERAEMGNFVNETGWFPNGEAADFGTWLRSAVGTGRGHSVYEL